MPSRILALHTDGITTTAAVFQRSKGAPEELGRAKVSGSEPAAVLAEILRLFGEQKVSVPKQVILASDRAVLSRAELPVHPDRPRAYAQMRELARWESEMAFSDLPQWDVESILRATGAIPDKSDARIREEIAHRESLSMGGPSPRYQDVALSLGVIDRGRRDGAVQIVEALNEPVGEAGVGWAPIAGRGASDTAQHPWLLSAVTQPERESWAAACRDNKLRLTGILPAWGLSEYTACAGQDKEALDAPRLLLERHTGGFSLAHLEHGSLESLRVVSLTRADAPERDLLTRVLDGRTQERIFVSGFDADLAEHVTGLFPDAMIAPDGVGTLLAGAAAQGLGLKDRPSWPAPVAPAEPAPPMWKNDNILRAGLVGVVVLGILVVDGMTRFEKNRLQAELDEKKAEFEKRKTVADAIRSAIGEAKALQIQIDETVEEIGQLGVRKSNALYLQDRRQEVTEGVIEALRDAIPRGVVLREIVESRRAPQVFAVSAWALDDIDAERFIEQLNSFASDLGLVVTDEAVFAERGPRDVPGYAAQLRLVPDGYRTGRQTKGALQ